MKAFYRIFSYLQKLIIQLSDIVKTEINKDAAIYTALEYLPYLPFILIPFLLLGLMVMLFSTFMVIPFVVLIPFLPLLPLLPLLIILAPFTTISPTATDPFLPLTTMTSEFTTKLTLGTQSLVFNVEMLMLAMIALSIALPHIVKYAKQNRINSNKEEKAKVVSEKDVPRKAITSSFDNYKRTSSKEESKNEHVDKAEVEKFVRGKWRNKIK